MIAIDLGAESCRVSLLRWLNGSPHIELVHRHPNAPVNHNGELRWDLGQITQQIDAGLRKCAEIATEGVRSIAAEMVAPIVSAARRIGSASKCA